MNEDRSIAALPEVGEGLDLKLRKNPLGFLKRLLDSFDRLANAWNLHREAHQNGLVQFKGIDELNT